MMKLHKQLTLAQGKPSVHGDIRLHAEDFTVNEVLGFSPDHEGEHVFLHIRKRNSNTEWIAKQLARLANVKPVHISYAGMKDRNAVTSQWFSVNMAGHPEPDWKELETDQLTVLCVDHNRRKLRRGSLSGNHFEITIRNIKGDPEKLDTRLQCVSGEGVPNYFGEQRFGKDYSNLDWAELMFVQNKRVQNRYKRSIYISAARSWLFNLVLSQRVVAGNWNRAIDGDLMMLDGSNSFFYIEHVDEEINQRVTSKDIHPTGPLWGQGECPTRLDAENQEQEVLEHWSSWLKGLEKLGLKQQRRALRVVPADMKWEFHQNDSSLIVRFFLPAGAYATSVLREIIDYQ